MSISPTIDICLASLPRGVRGDADVSLADRDLLVMLLRADPDSYIDERGPLWRAIGLKPCMSVNDMRFATHALSGTNSCAFGIADISIISPDISFWSTLYMVLRARSAPPVKTVMRMMTQAQSDPMTIKATATPPIAAPVAATYDSSSLRSITSCAMLPPSSSAQTVGPRDGAVDGLPVGTTVGESVVGAAEGAVVQIEQRALPHNLPSTHPHSFEVQRRSAQ